MLVYPKNVDVQGVPKDLGGKSGDQSIRLVPNRQDHALGAKRAGRGLVEGSQALLQFRRDFASITIFYRHGMQHVWRDRHFPCPGPASPRRVTGAELHDESSGEFGCGGRRRTGSSGRTMVTSSPSRTSGKCEMSRTITYSWSSSLFTFWPRTR